MKGHLGPTPAEVKTKPGPTLPCPVSQATSVLCCQLCWQGCLCTCVTLGKTKDCDGGGSPKAWAGGAEEVEKTLADPVGPEAQTWGPQAISPAQADCLRKCAGSPF